MESSTPTDHMAARRALAGITVLVVCALFAPALSGRDSFPISTQPMYADERPSVERFVTARAADGNDAPITLTMREIADTDDPLIARQRTRRAVREGDRGISALCRGIITRLPSDTPVDTVEIIEVRVDVVDFARTGASEPTVLARCTRP